MNYLKPVIIVCILTLFSCGEDAAPSDQGCPTELLCTEQFVSLTFSPKENGEFIKLDSYYSQNLDNGNSYNFDQSNNLPVSEFYVLITDGEMEEISKEGTVIRFFGIKDNQVIIEQDFIVGHDCCHVIPLQGPFGDL